MSAKPALLPRWGEDATGTIGPTELVPLSAKQDVGWANAEEPPAGYFNWLQRLTYKWLAYLKDAVFVADAGSVLPGVTATGDGASPGVKAIPGGGATPARGALNLPPQAAPTAPADGDLWTTAAGFFARIAGVTKTIIDQAYV